MRRKNKKTIKPNRIYTQGDWPKDRPENPCKVFTINSKKDLEQQIRDALHVEDSPEGYKAIWLPDSFEHYLDLGIIEGVPVKYAYWNRGGSQGIWLEKN